MIKISKEKLLRYFPYRIENGQRIKNESIYQALNKIQNLLWNSIDVDGELALRLFDYQADVSQRIEHFQKMRGELGEELQERLEEMNNKRKKLVNKHFSREDIARNPTNIPFHKARNPDMAEKEFNDLQKEYQDVLDELKKIDNDFSSKMKGVKSIKLNNTEQWTRDEVENLPGPLVRAISPLIEDNENEKNENENQKDN